MKKAQQDETQQPPEASCLFFEPLRGGACSLTFVGKKNSLSKAKGKSNTMTPKKIGTLIKHIAATTFALAGIWGSVQLLRDHSISELTFVALLGLCCIVGLFIAFSDRVEILSIRELKITLRKIEDSKKGIQELAVRTALLVALSRKGAILYNGASDIEINEEIEAILKLSEVEPDDPILKRIKDAGIPVECDII